MTETAEAIQGDRTAFGAAAFRDRIIGEGWEDPEQLLANPKNWRIHPKTQEDALEAVLSAVGWVQRIVVNQRTGFVVDGHLRVALALRRGEPKVPVLYVDLTAEEEDLILTSLDPIGAMAGTDREKLTELLGAIVSDDERVQSLLTEIRARTLDFGGSESVEVEAVAAAGGAKISLQEQFGVPPFSVLDARQGYWQDRKRAWLALGIKSELGRGENLQSLSKQAEEYRSGSGNYAKSGAVQPAGQGGMSAGLEKKRNAAKTAAKKPAQAIPGGAGKGSVYRKKGFASPGGSPRPAMKTKGGKTQRGDGAGRPLKKGGKK